MELTLNALRARWRGSQRKKDEKGLKDEIDAFLARERYERQLRKADRETRLLHDTLQNKLHEIRIEMDTLIKKHRTHVTQETQRHREEVDRMTRDADEVKVRSKNMEQEIYTLQSSSIKARDESDSQLKAAKVVQKELKKERTEIKQRLTEREKEVKLLNARLRLHAEQTKDVLNEKKQKKVREIIREKDQLIASFKTENTVLADRNLELMARLEVVQKPESLSSTVL